MEERSPLDLHVRDLELRVSRLEKREKVRRIIRVVILVFIALYMLTFIILAPRLLDSLTSI